MLQRRKGVRMGSRALSGTGIRTPAAFVDGLCGRNTIKPGEMPNPLVFIDEALLPNSRQSTSCALRGNLSNFKHMTAKA